MKKLLPPSLFYLCILLMIGFKLFLPIKDIISFPYNITGIVPLIAGLLISALGSQKFKKEETNIKTFNEPDKLVTDGLFKYSRNPMYLGFVLILAGVSVLTGAVSSIIILVLFIIIVDRRYIAFEENILEKKFGGVYVEYRSKTAKWF